MLKDKLLKIQNILIELRLLRDGITPESETVHNEQ